MWPWHWESSSLSVLEGCNIPLNSPHLQVFLKLLQHIPELRQAWPVPEPPCSSALPALAQSWSRQDAQASYQPPFSAGKSPLACRYEEGQIRTLHFSSLPSKDILVFCFEHKADPVQLWNAKGIRRKASRVGGKQNAEGFWDMRW